MRGGSGGGDPSKATHDREYREKVTNIASALKNSTKHTRMSGVKTYAELGQL